MQSLDHLSNITQYTSSLVESGHFFHAYIFRGFRGIGKGSLARAFASAILCLDPQKGVSCGLCASCQTTQHPDFLELTPQDKKFVSIDAVRDFQKALQLTPVHGKKRIGFVPDMSTLRLDAWNALLKTLEEPSKSTILVMIYNEGQYLLPTVASRCHHVHCLHVASKDRGNSSQVFYGNRPYFERDNNVDDDLQKTWTVLDGVLCSSSCADSFVRAHRFVSNWKKKETSEILFHVDAWIVFLRELLRFKNHVASPLSKQYDSFQQDFSKRSLSDRLYLLFELRSSILQKKSIRTHIFIENFSIL